MAIKNIYMMINVKPPVPQIFFMKTKLIKPANPVLIQIANNAQKVLIKVNVKHVKKLIIFIKEIVLKSRNVTRIMVFLLMGRNVSSVMQNVKNVLQKVMINVWLVMKVIFFTKTLKLVKINANYHAQIHTLKAQKIMFILVKNVILPVKNAQKNHSNVYNVKMVSFYKMKNVKIPVKTAHFKLIVIIIISVCNVILLVKLAMDLLWIIAYLVKKLKV